MCHDANLREEISTSHLLQNGCKLAKTCWHAYRLIGSGTSSILFPHAQNHRVFADMLFPDDKCIGASAECIGDTDLPAEQRLMCML